MAALCRGLCGLAYGNDFDSGKITKAIKFLRGFLTHVIGKGADPDMVQKRCQPGVFVMGNEVGVWVWVWVWVGSVGQGRVG